jgi:hypothetical protein
MNAYIDLTLTALIAVYIVDVSGFTDSWRSALARLIHVKALRPLPPFDCGKCMTFWACLIVSLCEGTFGIATIAFSALMSLLSLPLGELMISIRERLLKWIGRI